jgi:putative iron-dependent peroxidase
VPWATATEQGLHFVSFGQDLDRFDLQLRHQYGLADDGVEDRLLDFTTPLTGSFWWTPSVEALDAVAPVDVDDD